MYISSLILLFQKSDKFGQNINWCGDPQGIPSLMEGLSKLGDDGLNNTWGLYYKNVSHGDEYVTSFVSNTEMRQLCIQLSQYVYCNPHMHTDVTVRIQGWTFQQSLYAYGD